MSLEKSQKRPRDDNDNDDDNKCTAELRGACDCKKCLERIIRNTNKLLKNGWHINYFDNGAGGYGFDVANSKYLLHCIKCYKKTECEGEDYGGEDCVIVTEKMSNDQIEQMIQDVLPFAWTAYSTHDQLVTAWRKFWYLLE